MLFEKGDALEQIAGDRTNAGTRRSRVNSGRISLCDESRSVTTQPEEIDLDKVFVLERDSASSRGKGYFFLLSCSVWCVAPLTLELTAKRSSHLIQQDQLDPQSTSSQETSNLMILATSKWSPASATWILSPQMFLTSSLMTASFKRPITANKDFKKLLT